MRGKLVDAGLLAGCLVFLAISAEVVVLRRQLDAADQSIASTLAPPVQSGERVPHLVFVFRPSDCPFALQVIDRWNAEARAGTVAVTGMIVPTTKDTAGIRDVIRSYRIEFPVSIASGEDVAGPLARLGVSKLPVSLLFDAQGGLRAVGPGATTDQDSTVVRLLKAAF